MGLAYQLLMQKTVNDFSLCILIYKRYLIEIFCIEPAEMRLLMKTTIKLLLSFIILFGLSIAAFSQASIKEGVEVRQTRISVISKSIDDGSVNFTQARGALRLIRNEAREAIEMMSKQEDDIQDQLTDLGEVPVDGSVELGEITERRKALTTQLEDIRPLIAQAKLNEADSNRQLNALLKIQRSSFLYSTFALERSAFSRVQWKEIGESTAILSKKAPAHYAQWRATRQELGRFTNDKFRFLGLFFFWILLVFPFRYSLAKAFSKSLSPKISDDLRTYVFLMFQIAIRVVPAAFGFFLIYQSLISSGFVTADYAPTLRLLICMILLVLFSDGMMTGLFNPAQSEKGIIPLEGKTAKTAHRIAICAVILFGMGWTVTSISKINPDLNNLAHGSTIIMALGISVLTFIAVIFTRWAVLPDQLEVISETTRRRWGLVRKAGLPLIILIFIALTFGYLNLANFIAARIVLFIGLFLGVWIFRKTLLSVINYLDKSFSTKQPNVTSSSRQAMLFWAGLFLDGFVLLSLIPILLLALGTDSYSVKTGMLDAFTGITVGNFTLSIADILTAIITFFVILFVTRFLQRTLDVRLFEKSGADVGFRNSFRTLLGYAGLITAILAAIGVVGLDLSNLAIIAGALSVGIGFGLQSIVNNFVSGLILLFERPVKVGDWIVTQSGEGFVKQISVRSTEIETFDRASIIVPNSELISSSVTNWTHKNKMGRIILPVGVSYNSDVKRVRELLLKVAKSNQRVLKSPVPMVHFKGFGDNSLDMELRIFISNIADGPVVKNDLRFDILDAFRQENIEIPFPQRDVHIIK